MTTRSWTKRAVAGAVLALGLSLGACSEATEALNSASGALDRAQACTEALGVVTSFNPQELSPEQIKQQAGKKAEELRTLGEKVGDTSVQNALFSVADGYVALENRQAESLSNVNDWVQNNVDKINALKNVCTGSGE